MAETFISVDQLAKRQNRSKASIWRALKDDPSFPRPYRFSPGCTRFKLSEVEAWETARAEAA